jgi:cyclase
MPTFCKTRKAAAVLAIAVGCGAFAVLPSAAQQPGSDLEVLEVQPRFYMIAGAGGNIGVQIGSAGIILVDAGSANMSGKVLAALKKLTDKPIRYIFDTSADPDHAGGNATLSKAGVSIIAGTAGNALSESVLNNNGAASVFAHDNVLMRMSGEDTSQWPTKTFTSKLYTMSLNEDGIEVFHEPAAHSDGDSFVLFRRANVIVTGELFNPTHFPVIEIEKGGSIQGELDALNHLLELTIPPYPLPWQPERTFLVPGHGPISDSHDLLEYRDMVTIVRDVIEDMVKRGMTLDQIKAANPTNGYNARYGASEGPWTTDMFVTAVYKGLTSKVR